MVAMASFIRYQSVVAAVLALLMLTAEADKFKGSDWTPAHATFYGDDSGVSDDMGGACGYSNMNDIGFGINTAALSTPLFDDGRGCGGCYQIRCYGSPYCLPGAKSVIVTGTNLCPPNWAEDSDNGGWCNPPRLHFDMAKPCWLKIGQYEGGIIPVMYRRVPCKRSGGIRFILGGNAYWLLVHIVNVGGAGDISAMWVVGSDTGKVQMTQNFGAVWQAFANLGGQELSFIVQAGSSNDMITCNSVTDQYWSSGLTYQAKINFN